MRNSSRKLDDQSLLGEVVMALMLAACLAVGTTSFAEEMEEEVVELETFIAGEEVEDVVRSSYEIEIGGERFEAKASARPMYDPGSVRIRI